MSDKPLDYDIVMITADEWSGLERVRHRIAEYFSADHRILFVEDPRLTILSAVKRKSRLKRLFTTRRLRRKENIYIFSPSLCLPCWQRSRYINEINNFLLASTIKKAVTSLRFKNIVMWYFYYNHAPMLGKLAESVSVYTAHDAWEERGLNCSATIAQMEKELASSVDVVFYTGLANYEKKRVYNRQSFYIPHGAPRPVFRKMVRPADMPTCGKILGYWGLVYGNAIDISLLEQISDCFPDEQVVLIGEYSHEIFDEIRRLGRRNIHLLGAKSRDQMECYLSNFDVGLIPYPRIPFRLSCSPLKVYDYLAFGMPVVSIDIRELDYMKDLVYISCGDAEFLSNIKMALSEDSRLKQNRWKFCYKNAWHHRMMKMKSLIENRLTEYVR